MDKGGLDKIVDGVASAYPYLSPWIFVMIGRAYYYAHILKRFPTLTEWMLEPLMIGFMGVFCAGGMLAAGELLGADFSSPLIIGFASSLGGVYGTKCIVMVCNAVAIRIGGKDGCVVHDLIEPKNKDENK